MDVRLIPIKIEQRLNKLASNDYDNIECWQIVEAFNKAQLQWVRRQLHGGNIYKEGAEQTIRRIDDLQILLTKKTLSKKNERKDRVTFGELPSDYLQYKRIDLIGKIENCGEVSFTSNLVEEANLNKYLTDPTLRPSANWRETIHTISNNTVTIYTNQEFKPLSPELIYYRMPREISLKDCVDINGEEKGDVNPEFKDDVVELIIDEAVSILAGDIESPSAGVLAENRINRNN